MRMRAASERGVRASEACSKGGFKLNKADNEDDDDERVDELFKNRATARARKKGATAMIKTASALLPAAFSFSFGSVA